MKKLLIVESPSKSKTIEQYLGSDFKVLSSKGHVRDLATSGKGGLGVDVDTDFTAHYVVSKDKKAVVKELKAAVKEADEVYLATDPDREGEAISWHLAQLLDLPVDIDNRVVFNEITKDSVIEGMKHARKIDGNLVKSQETRRILDRIIGFKLSKLLQNKIKSKSAGRVQSVALKLIVDREREIAAFVPEEYWEITAYFNEANVEFKAKLVKHKNKKLEIHNVDEATAIMNQLTSSYQVESIQLKDKKRSSKLPFITSTLQQESSSKLGFNARKTMQVAQKLYEGIDLKDEIVGLISYMRTDSTRLSPVFVEETKHYIEDKYGKQYVGKVKQAKAKDNVQDAHEAIRPTSIHRTPESVKPFLSPDEFKLYRLIYYRTLASLMSDALMATTQVVLENQDYQFNANGSTIKFDGYLVAYSDYEKVGDELLPTLTEKTTLEANKTEPTQHFTKGPSRYTEPKLIKAMEELGIGRPSTYAQTIDTIKARSYVDYQDKQFSPTEQGFLTSDKLNEHFSDLINVEYTAKMENELDVIAEGQEDHVAALREFYTRFEKMVEEAYEKMEKIEPVKTGEACPKCGHDLVIRKGRYGDFVACSNFPECDYIKPEDGIGEPTGEDCPECGSPMIYKKGRFGKFEACSNYPTCKYIKKTKQEYPKPSDEICDKCGSPMVIKRGRYGEFLACSDYPTCKNIKKIVQ